MGNNKLTEAQSLELITSMINDSRSRLARNSGTPFLIWGYTTVAVALLNCVTTYLQLSHYWNFSGLAIPFIGWIGMMLFNKKEKGARNLIDRIISIVSADIMLYSNALLWAMRASVNSEFLRRLYPNTLYVIANATRSSFCSYRVMYAASES